MKTPEFSWLSCHQCIAAFRLSKNFRRNLNQIGGAQKLSRELPNDHFYGHFVDSTDTFAFHRVRVRKLERECKKHTTAPNMRNKSNWKFKEIYICMVVWYVYVHRMCMYDFSDNFCTNSKSTFKFRVLFSPPFQFIQRILDSGVEHCFAVYFQFNVIVVIVLFLGCYIYDARLVCHTYHTAYRLFGLVFARQFSISGGLLCACSFVYFLFLFRCLFKKINVLFRLFSMCMHTCNAHLHHIYSNYVWMINAPMAPHLWCFLLASIRKLRDDWLNA